MTAMTLYTEHHRKALADAVRKRMADDLGMTFARIAEASGLNDRTVRKVVSDRVDPRASTLTALERGLRDIGIVPETVIVKSPAGREEM